MYAAPGIPGAVAFTLHPAIRNGQPNISGCPATTFECPDEECGCPFTHWALCALRATKTSQKQQVNFLSCFDQNNIAYSNDWVPTMPSANQSALQCVNQTNPAAYEAVVECGMGPMAEKLKRAAADYFHETFPMYWTGDRFDVPHLYINDVEQVINLDGEDSWTFLKALCEGGASSARRARNLCRAVGAL